MLLPREPPTERSHPEAMGEASRIAPAATIASMATTTHPGQHALSRRPLLRDDMRAIAGIVLTWEVRTHRACRTRTRAGSDFFPLARRQGSGWATWAPTCRCACPRPLTAAACRRSAPFSERTPSPAGDAPQRQAADWLCWAVVLQAGLAAAENVHRNAASTQSTSSSKPTFHEAQLCKGLRAGLPPRALVLPALHRPVEQLRASQSTPSEHASPAELNQQPQNACWCAALEATAAGARVGDSAASAARCSVAFCGEPTCRTQYCDQRPLPPRSTWHLKHPSRGSPLELVPNEPLPRALLAENERPRP